MSPALRRFRGRYPACVGIAAAWSRFRGARTGSTPTSDKPVCDAESMGGTELPGHIAVAR